MFQSSSATKAAPDTLISPASSRNRSFNPRARQKPRPTCVAPDPLTQPCRFNPRARQKPRPTWIISDNLIFKVSILERDKSRARHPIDTTLFWLGVFQSSSATKAAPDRLGGVVANRTSCFNPRARQKPRPTWWYLPLAALSASFNPRARQKPRPTSPASSITRSQAFQSSSATKAAPDDRNTRTRTTCNSFNPRARQKPRPTF